MGIIFHFTDVKTKAQRSYIIAQGHSASAGVEIKTMLYVGETKIFLKLLHTLSQNCSWNNKRSFVLTLNISLSDTYLYVIIA